MIYKIFEKLLCKQITIFIDPLLSKYQCGFRKGFSAQHCLLAMLEKWKNAVDKGKVFGALLTDLSKAFDCLPHELIITKLNTYGFNFPALKLMQLPCSLKTTYQGQPWIYFMGGNTFWGSTRLYIWAYFV